MTSRQFPSFVTASAHETLALSRDAQTTISRESFGKRKDQNTKSTEDYKMALPTLNRNKRKENPSRCLPVDCDDRIPELVPGDPDSCYPSHLAFWVPGFLGSAPAFLLQDNCWAGRGHLVAHLQNCTLLSEGLPAGQGNDWQANMQLCTPAPRPHSLPRSLNLLFPSPPFWRPHCSAGLLACPLQAFVPSLLLGKAKQLFLSRTLCPLHYGGAVSVWSAERQAMGSG